MPLMVDKSGHFQFVTEATQIDAETNESTIVEVALPIAGDERLNAAGENSRVIAILLGLLLEKLDPIVNDLAKRETPPKTNKRES